MVCGIAYNDTLGAAYTAYIKPGTQEDIYAIRVQQSIQADASPWKAWQAYMVSKQGHKISCYVSQKCQKNTSQGHLARKGKVYSRMRQ